MHCGLVSGSPYPASTTRPHRRAIPSTSSNTASAIGPGSELDEDVFVVSGHIRQRRLQRLVNSTCTAIGSSGGNGSEPAGSVTCPNSRAVT